MDQAAGDEMNESERMLAAGDGALSLFFKLWLAAHDRRSSIVQSALDPSKKVEDSAG